jgi:hypothetical protein
MRGGMNISWGCFLCPHRLDIPRTSPLGSCYHATPEVQTAKWRIPATSHDHVKWNSMNSDLEGPGHSIRNCCLQTSDPHRHRVREERVVRPQHIELLNWPWLRKQRSLSTESSRLLPRIESLLHY